MIGQSEMNDRNPSERQAMPEPTAAVPDRLIVVDDNSGITEFVTTVAESCGYEACAASSLPALKALLPTFRPTVIALDLTMPDADGIEVMTWLAQAGYGAHVLLISGTTPDLLSAATKLGSALGLNIVGTLAKPFGLGVLRGHLNDLSLVQK